MAGKEVTGEHRFKHNIHNGHDECTCGETFTSFGDWAGHAGALDSVRLNRGPSLPSGAFGEGDFGVIKPSRHPNSARFHAILKELGDLHDKKQADYGRGDDPFANVRSTQAFGVKPWVGAMIRLNDKIVRLQSLIANGKLANESADDSLRDIAVYAIIALVLFEQEEKDGR